jgi:hypothetical protein
MSQVTDVILLFNLVEEERTPNGDHYPITEPINCWLREHYDGDELHDLTAVANSGTGFQAVVYAGSFNVFDGEEFMAFLRTRPWVSPSDVQLLLKREGTSRFTLLDMFTFHSWREELLFYGNIVQDADESVGESEAVRRARHYGAMLNAVSGSEGVETFIALVDSLQSEEDYGVYQQTYNTPWRFSPSVAAQGLVTALPALIRRNRDLAGNVLCGFANATTGDGYGHLLAFNSALGSASAERQAAIMDFILREEDDGWLDGRRKGVIRPVARPV